MWLFEFKLVSSQKYPLAIFVQWNKFTIPIIYIFYVKLRVPHQRGTVLWKIQLRGNGWVWEWPKVHCVLLLPYSEQLQTGNGKTHKKGNCRKRHLWSTSPERDWDWTWRARTESRSLLLEVHLPPTTSESASKSWDHVIIFSSKSSIILSVSVEFFFRTVHVLISCIHCNLIKILLLN